MRTSLGHTVMWVHAKLHG